MCDNVFKNEEEYKRKQEFTKLFAQLASNLVFVNLNTIEEESGTADKAAYSKKVTNRR